MYVLQNGSSLKKFTTSGWDLTFFKVVIITYYKMINLDSITNENNKEHDEKSSYIPDHPYRIVIIGGSG